MGFIHPALGVGFILPAAKPTSLSSRPSPGPHMSVVPVGATRGTTAAGAKEEKSLFEWILGALQKDEQLLETDPVLKKVEDKAPSKPARSPASASASSPKNDGGFGGLGGLFAKK